MLLIKNCELYNPSPKGKKDILISSRKFEYISDKIEIPKENFPEVKEIDAEGLIAVPGIIDLHVHIIGGGGEAGFTSRTPELMLSDFTLNGITTVIGLLGTDGITRNMAGLLAKARALEEEGLTTFMWTGCYQMPTRTLTDNARSDIIIVDKIIGVGEIAVSDHRGSHPSGEQLIYLASEARIGGMLSGKCGVLQLHIGDGKKGLEPVNYIIENSEIPFDNILPTHVNRNSMLFNQSIEYALKGGYVDITTGIQPESKEDDVIHPAEGYKTLLEKGVDPYHITMSSDAGGSMPIFDKEGTLISIGVGKPSTNLEILKNCVELGISMENALIPLTASPARLLRLRGKGNVKEGCEGDLLLLDKDFKVHTLISRGNVMVSNYKPVIVGKFEKSLE